MSKYRQISKILTSKPTMEGAGVRLKRVFGYNEVPLLDPFLLLDDFHSANPDDYIAGFPWHPHRGIETVTYMLHGKVKHEDSIGNRGVIQNGDVQWMTAGSGIIHSEMPQQENGLLWGFQLWVNLPASNKMMTPRYQEIEKNQIPEILLENDVRIRIISGEFNGTTGPVTDIVVDPIYLDVSIPPNSPFKHKVKSGYTAFVYVIEGGGFFDVEKSQFVGSEHLVIFTDGDEIAIQTDKEPVHFLLISGKPIGEPIAWYGPIVMNTEEELKTAFREYQNGSFLKYQGGSER
ncbi:MAG: pirin family protein [Candidatus Heimdallarchaeota archaeon]|nr:MAG: pirin family protein [Candidatus Heimdallarchaeota archaeon]